MYSENYTLIRRSTMTQTDEKIYCVFGFEEKILSKLLYYPRQSTDYYIFFIAEGLEMVDIQGIIPRAFLPC